VESDTDTCRQTDNTKLISTFCDYGNAVKKGHLCIGRADFLHVQRHVKLTSLTLEFAVLPFLYSEDIIVNFVCIQGICRPYHSDPP
jgi:hypothetical protein